MHTVSFVLDDEDMLPPTYEKIVKVSKEQIMEQELPSYQAAVRRESCIINI